MNKLEKLLWKQLKDNTKHLNPHLQRIESGSTGQGIPDVNGCWNGQEAWIELKVVRGRKVLIEPMQVNWHRQRAKAGGNVWILAEHDIEATYYLWHGKHAAEVQEHGIDTPGAQRFVKSLWTRPRDMWEDLLKSIFLQQ